MHREGIRIYLQQKVKQYNNKEVYTDGLKKIDKKIRFAAVFTHIKKMNLKFFHRGNLNT